MRTALTRLAGVRHPIVQTGMGWVAGPRLVSATANAGGLGILASATMTLAELENAIERAVIIASGRQIELEDLPEAITKIALQERDRIKVERAKAASEGRTTGCSCGPGIWIVTSIMLGDSGP